MKLGIKDVLLPGVPFHEVIKRLPARGRIREQFQQTNSSIALAVNVFGLFLASDPPHRFPLVPMPAGLDRSSMDIDILVDCPISGKRGAPSLSTVLITTPEAIISVKGRRFEPYQSLEPQCFADFYTKRMWGSRMAGHDALRDDIAGNLVTFEHVDAALLIRHAYALREMKNREPYRRGTAIMVYLFAVPPGFEPCISKARSSATHARNSMPAGRQTRRFISDNQRARHREELRRYADAVKGDEVKFLFLTYRELLNAWRTFADPAICAHADAVEARYKLAP